MPTRILQPREIALDQSVPRIFNQVQESAANHKKNYVALHKIQAELAEHTEKLQKGKLVRLTGERMFQDKFIYMLCRTLPLKKGIDSADRTVNFVAGYVKFVNEKDLEEKDPDDDDETYASRFTARLLGFLLGGFEAKDKNVRFRVVQSVTEMISHLGAIDEDVYGSLHDALVARLTWDKETAVRYQAAHGVAKLSATEDVSEVEEGGSLLDKLIGTSVYDSSPEVRRAALVNIPVNEQTIFNLLDRIYDTDVTIRKALYSSILPNISPRDLNMPQREFVVRKGLGDREPSVKAAAASLIATWIDALHLKAEGDDPKDGHASTSKVEDGVVSLLRLFDLTQDVAVDALLSVFSTRVDIFNNIEFNEQYWIKLTAETAFLARVFVEHCKAIQDETRLEASLPVVTNVAFSIGGSYKSLVDLWSEDASNIDEAERTRREDARLDRESVIAELLKLAVHLDYSDEIGRRKMFQLVRNMLAKHEMPEMLLAPCLDVMRTLSPSEQELIRIVVEIVHELRNVVDADDDNDDEVDGTQEGIDGINLDGIPVKPKSTKKLSAEQKLRLDQVNLKSLALCIGVLERVNSTLEDNVTLDGILEELIIPSVQRIDILFRERGLKCLALCCLIAKRLAIKSIPLFMSQIPSSPVSIKIILLEALFDIFMEHDADMFRNHDNNIEALTLFLIGHMEGEQDPKVKALLCKGTAKLVLAGMITDVDMIKNLIKTYLSPLTVDNQELRQCLAFFLQMYSYSSPANQKRMCEIFIHVFFDVNEDRKIANDEEQTEQKGLVSSAQVAAMFIDWTDPLRLSQAINARGTQGGTNADECVQLDMAEDILKILFEKDLKVSIEKEDKRVLCQMLNKLHVPDTVDDYRIRSLKLLVDNLRARRPLRDFACKTALTKFETTISKKFEKQLQHFTEEEFRKLEELNELFEFVDSIIPLDDNENQSVDAPRRSTRKRRSESVPGTGTETESYHGSPPPKKDKGRSKSKRPRFSISDDDVSTPRGTPLPNVPARTLPKRSAAAKSFKPTVIIISSDSDEYDHAPPRRKQNAKSGVRSTPPIKEERELKQLDDTIEHLFDDSSAPFDSIMDSDSEEEEDEVNDLLAKV